MTFHSKLIIGLLAGLLALGFSSGSYAADYPENSVGTNKLIPKSKLKAAVREEMHQALMSTPYDGFAMINGRLGRDGKFQFNSPKKNKSYPDNRWDELAVEMAGRVTMRGSTTGTKLRPSARAYVAIFANGLESLTMGRTGPLAYVVVEQVGSGAATAATGGFVVYEFKLSRSQIESIKAEDE